MSGSSLPRLRASLRTSWGYTRTHAQKLAHSPRARRIAAILAAVLLVYALLGFLAAPPLLRNYLQNHSGEMLGRPLSLGQLHFNPFTLNLRAEKLHLPDADGKTSFVDIDKLTVNASWSSLFRLAPVLDELRLDRPRITITRGKDQRFNFSDLIERFTAKPSPQSSKPVRFSLSNISVHDGDIQLDDRLLGTRHHVEKLELGIPFLANLPSSTNIFVQPLLAMTVDGSPLHIEGHAKPFASSRESTFSFQLDRLDLPRYLGYVPTAMPVAIPKGLLSGQLSLQFAQAQPMPQLRLTGNLQLDDLVLDSSHGDAIARLGHGNIELTDVQPLASRYHLGAMKLERLALFYTQHAGGHSNFDTLMPSPARTDETRADEKTASTDLRIAALTLQDSELDYTDANQARLQLTRLHGNLLGLGTLAGPAAKLDLGSQLAGGDLHVRGDVDIAASHYAGSLELKQIQLAPLQDLAASSIATRIAAGNLDASGKLSLDWGKTFNLHIEPAQLGINDFAVEPQAKGLATPLAWHKLDASIARIDLATREVQLDKLTANGLQLDAIRSRDNRINLFADTHPVPGNADEGQAWRWDIARFDLEQGSLLLTDHSIDGDKPTPLLIDALNGSVDGLSNKLDQPHRIKLEGRIGRGSFTTTGTLQPLPTVADLQLITKRLDIAGFVPYASVPLNVKITSARLSSDGKLHYDGRHAEPRFTYRGHAAFERVRMQDKLTGDDFMRWASLSGSRIDLRYGEGTPRVHLGGLALEAFYARVIVNSNGRLNLSDVIASGEQAPVSVTRAGDNAPTAPSPATSVPTPPAVPAADIHIGEITLANGQLNYTDNFIKPNYTANLTSLTGKIGAFGTTAGEPPAELLAQAKLDDDSPVDISGHINPLQPVASLDITGKATDVELTRLSTYSGKYTGYPITNGRLTADVHYLLDQGKLKADNHLFITQLTFGDRMDSPGVSHLPVKLAVALLKDSEGNIDVNVPVSGSLDDPQFSLGGMIMRAFGNLIAKAATAPFRLLASAFGGGNHEDLGYVEFAPGSAVLDARAKDRLGQIVQMLSQKLALTLDISGRVDPSLDQAGLRKVTVDNQLRREKLAKESGDKAAEGASAATLAEVTMTPDEYPRYLRRTYRHADFEKPENALGFNKSLEPDAMRSLLETHVNTDAATMRALAERRATAVQDWLHGKLDDKRITIKPPHLDAAGIDDKGKTTRADFGLH